VACKVFTERMLKALKPAAEATRYEIWDGVVPSLGVRVTDKGRVSFFVMRRPAGHPKPIRLTLGTYPAMTLPGARQAARGALDELTAGLDPRATAAARQAAEDQRRHNTFGQAAEAFIAKKLANERKGQEVERDIRREFMPLWQDRPITEISPGDVRRAIKAIVDRGAPAQARNVLGTAKRLFSWTVDQGDVSEGGFGLASSPAAGLKPAALIGERTTGDRILSDLELWAFWRAVRRLPYPWGPVYRLLILTAMRLNEVADTERPEIESSPDRWIIPKERMKGQDNGKHRARAHLVPITKDIAKELAGLPRFKNGKFVFSTKFGEKPVWMSDKIKKKLDSRMLLAMRALARKRGEDQKSVALPRWTNHDLRRTVRSGLSRLRIAEEVREAVLAHVRPGIKKVYDLYDYADEKRDALEKWAVLLRGIVDSAGPNVVPLRLAG
jgi:integrase